MESLRREERAASEGSLKCGSPKRLSRVHLYAWLCSCCLCRVYRPPLAAVLATRPAVYNCSPKGCCCSSEKVSEGRCCRNGRVEQLAHSCCSKTRNQPTTCNCGLNCQCEHTRQPSPALPPVERNPQTEIVAGEVAVRFRWQAIFEPSHMGCPKSMVADGHALNALDRCVSLCRLIL